MANGGGIASWFRGLFRGDPPPPPAPPEPPPKPTPRDEDTPHLERWNGKPGQLRSASVVNDVRIQGVPCKAGTMVTFHGNGRICTATLASAWASDGEEMSAGALVLIESDGKLGSWNQPLAADREFRVRAAGSEKLETPVTLATGSDVCWESGQLRQVVLAAPAAFDGMSFPTGTKLLFGDSGALSHVTCREEIELRGIRWAARREVVFEFGYLREGYPADDGVYEGIPYQVDEIVRLHDNGRMARCYLSEAATISGVPCAANTRIYVDDEGHLLEATIAEDCMIAGIPVAADSAIGLEDGKPTLFKPREDVEVDGIPCAKQKMLELDVEGHLVRASLSRAHTLAGWELPAGSTIVLDDGKLEQLVVTDATAPDGRDLRGMWRIFLDDAGTIRRALPVHDDRLDGIWLRDRVTIDGLVAAAETGVKLERDGRLTSLVLATDQSVAGMLAKAGARVHFHDNGTPSNLYLAQDARISDVPCAAATTQVMLINGVERTFSEEVRLHANGTLSFARLAAATTRAGIPLAGGETIALHDNGTLRVGTLAERWRHPLGFVARKGTLLGLDADGSLQRITIDASHVLDGIEHAAGTVLSFIDGRVQPSAHEQQIPLGPCEPL